MKKMMNKLVVVRLAGLVLCTTLFSFSPDFGGDTFEIYLNNKLLVRHQLWMKGGVPEISLDPNMKNDQLFVYYSHCGQTGKGRAITIRNEKNSVLKEWNFSDTSEAHAPMNLAVKDLVALYHQEDVKIKLFYSSQELHKGLVLATIALRAETGVTGK